MSLNVDEKSETTPLIGKSTLKEKINIEEKYNPKPGFISSFTFEWVSKLVYKAYDSRLEFEDINELFDSEKGETNTRNLAANLEFYKPKNFFTLMVVLFLTNWKLVIWNFILNSISISCVLISPVFVQQLLIWFELEKSFNQQLWYIEGYGWVFAILVATLLGRTLGNSVTWNYWRLYIRIKSALVGVTYDKCLKISSASVSEQTTGKLVNLIAVDADRMADAFCMYNLLCITTFQIAACIGLLLYVIGYVTFVGIGVIVLLAPILFVLLGIFAALIGPALEIKDKRISVMNELLQNIKNIKFFTWEDEYEKKVTNVRSKEIMFFRIAGTLGGTALSIMAATPTLVTVSTLIVFSIIDRSNFKPQFIFPAMSYFVLLKFPLFVLPFALTESIQIFISANRVIKFLNSEILPDPNFSSNNEIPVNLNKATFKWKNSDESFKLNDISFKCPKGKFICVLGSVGAGKTSLLEGILGEMPLVSGSSEISGSIAYSPQQAWITNETLKNNILFGLPYDEKKYNQILEDCCLLPDLALLPGGDQAEIGEKGYNLSGGQKQRLSIARAAYRDCDIYLFDDPLSALDQYVGKIVFENCFMKMLEGKSRILVTHQIQYAKHADYIYILDNGKIVEEGIFEDLNKQGGKLSELLQKIKLHEEDEDLKKISEISKEKSNKSNENSTLIEMEDKEEGTVQLSVIVEYLKAFGFFWFFFIVALYVISQLAAEAPNWWISQWMTEKKDRLFDLSEETFFNVYVSGGYGSIILLLFRDVLFINLGMLASKFLHKAALKKLLNSPISFFEKNPIGRILSRFSNDVMSVDTEISTILQDVLTLTVQVFSTMVIIIYSSFWFLVPMLPLAIVYFIIQRLFRNSLRDMKRFSSVNRSPLYSHFSATLNGLSTIRAFKSAKRFKKDNFEKLNLMQRTFYSEKSLDMWLQFRLAVLGSFLVSSVSMVLMVIYHFTKGKNFNLASAGLAMTYSIQVIQQLAYMVEQSVKLESEFNSVERIVHYTKKLPQEQNEFKQNPPKNWPKNGEIVFKDFFLKYRENLPFVLKNINLSIKKNEKIGIAGRTGCGKSSLMLSLFRLVQHTKGQIFIDGIDVSTIPIRKLRSSIAIIPQDPVLFTGSIRSNIDPFSKYSDIDIWDALEKSHLKKFIGSLKEKLDSEVHEGGHNFSVGQRQLICLTRCILSKRKILIMDEATSSMDIETDSLIQKSIRENFDDCTILVIAHRLNTILR
eukprot:gene7696-12162_t